MTDAPPNPEVAGRCAGWPEAGPGPRSEDCTHRPGCGATVDPSPAVVVVEQPLGARRPLDAYDALRLQMLVRVLQRLVVQRPHAVLRSYSEAWRELGAPRRPWADESGVWRELADVDEALLQPALAFLDEAEFLPAPGDCLLVDLLLRARVREYGEAFCDACDQVHQLGRRR